MPDIEKLFLAQHEHWLKYLETFEALSRAHERGANSVELVKLAHASGAAWADWYRSFLDLTDGENVVLTPRQSYPFMVWRKGGSRPRQRHDTEDAAVGEATRLASAHPDAVFLVLREIMRCQLKGGGK